VWPKRDLLVWEVKEGSWLGNFIHGTIGLRPINVIQIGPTFLNQPAMLTSVAAVLMKALEVDELKPVLPPVRKRTLAMLWPVKLDGNQMKSMSPVPMLGGESDRLSGAMMAQNGFVFVGMEVRESPWVADAQGVKEVPVLAEKPSEPEGGLEASGRLGLGFWYYQPLKVWSAVMVVDFTQSTPVVREPVGMPGALIAVDNVGQAGGIVVAVDAIKQEVSTLVYDGVACWSYADAVLNGRSGLLAGGRGVVCRAVKEEASTEVQLEAFHFGKEKRQFARGGVWNEPGTEPLKVGVHKDQVYMGLISEGQWQYRLADLGAEARFENRRTVTMPAEDSTLNLVNAVVDGLGSGLWVPRGLYGVAYFPAATALVPQVMHEPNHLIQSVPVQEGSRPSASGAWLIGPQR
jgi:hypothetical protein